MKPRRLSQLLRRAQWKLGDLYLGDGARTLTVTQIMVLDAIRHAALPRSELITRTGIDRQTMLEMLRRLEASAMILQSRITATKAGRPSILAEITPKGLRVLDRDEKHLAEAEKTFFGGVSPKDRATFLRALRIITGEFT